MKELTIKKLIDFRQKSDNGKKSFAHSLKLSEDREDSKGGGNYWVICLRAIGKCYKENDNNLISDKIDEFEDKLLETDHERTKDMYARNIDILRRFEYYDFDRLRPSENFKIETKPKSQETVTISGLPVKVTPEHVFTFGDKSAKGAGAIWLVAKLAGYKPEELAMYTEALHNYLNTHYSGKYAIDAQYCIALDVYTGLSISFAQLQNGDIPKVLNSTLKEVVKYMK
jgi:hypothetical protein